MRLSDGVSSVWGFGAGGGTGAGAVAGLGAGAACGVAVAAAGVVPDEGVAEEGWPEPLCAAAGLEGSAGAADGAGAVTDSAAGVALPCGGAMGVALPCGGEMGVALPCGGDMGTAVAVCAKPSRRASMPSARPSTNNIHPITLLILIASLPVAQARFGSATVEFSWSIHHGFAAAAPSRSLASLFQSNSVSSNL